MGQQYIEQRMSPVREEALRWFVRSRADDFSAAENNARDEWLAANDAHRIEYAKLDLTWSELDCLASQIQGGSAHSLFATHRKKIVAGAVMMGVVLSVSLFVLLRAPHFTSPVGSRMNVAFVPGIDLLLDADSEVAISSNDHPEITLLRGSCYVEVGENAPQGLQVHVDDSTLRDIGTRFAVTKTSAGGRLEVAEGAVEISSAEIRQTLSGGHGVRFDDHHIGVVQEIKPESVAAWRDDIYRFDATPLLDVVDEIQRHSGLSIVIQDTSIGGLPISGSFGMKNPEQLLALITQIHGLRARRDGAGRVMLER